MFIREMIIAALSFITLLVITPVQAKEMWLKQDVICNDNPISILTFLVSQNLEPYIGGGGLSLDASKEQVATVLFINNKENSMAIMQYYHDRICLVGVIGEIIYDEQELRDFTRMDNR